MTSETASTLNSDSSSAQTPLSAALARPYSSRAERPTSFQVSDFPIPHGREEDWRFTPMKRIKPLLVDDYSKTELDMDISAPDQVIVSALDRSHAERLKLAGGPQDRAAALSWENWQHTQMVEIPEGIELSEPIILRRQANNSEVCAASIVIKAGKLSSGIVVIENFGHANLNETVQIVADTDAQLTVVSTQEWDDSSIHAANHRISAAQGAHVKHILVSLGGDLVRLCTDASFSAPGSNVELLGLYFTDAGQHQEHRIFVSHEQENCVSRVTYKGALQGKGAHSVWVGDVLIGKNGLGTDTYELNRNLILSSGARADSVPNLEIEVGEIVGAGHASATGRFDDEQLFYLQARGIPEEEARRLVVRGFFAELIQQIEVPEVSDHLMEKIEEELSQSSTNVERTTNV